MSSVKRDYSVMIYFLFFVIVFIGGAAIGWYRATIQADVYRREGIEISTWEVMCGAKPAERAIHIKDGSGK